MKWILLLLLCLVCSGCKTILVLGYWQDHPFVPDSRATAEFRVEKDWK